MRAISGRRHPRLVVEPLIGLMSLIALVAFWQIWVITQDVNALLMPTPVAVLSELWNNPSQYVRALGWTTLTALGGLLFGTTLGYAIAILCWLSRFATGLLSSTVLLLRSVPIVIIIPLLTRALGYNTATTLMIVSLISFFPAFVLASSGLRALPPSAADLAVVLGGSKKRTLVLLAVPASVNSLAASVRMAAGGCVLAAMVTEFLTGAAGIGQIFLLANSDLDTSRSWAASVVAALMSILVFRAAAMLERMIQKRMS